MIPLFQAFLISGTEDIFFQLDLSTVFAASKELRIGAEKLNFIFYFRNAGAGSNVVISTIPRCEKLLDPGKPDIMMFDNLSVTSEFQWETQRNVHRQGEMLFYRSNAGLFNIPFRTRTQISPIVTSPTEHVIPSAC